MRVSHVRSSVVIAVITSTSFLASCNSRTQPIKDEDPMTPSFRGDSVGLVVDPDPLIHGVPIRLKCSFEPRFNGTGVVGIGIMKDTLLAGDTIFFLEPFTDTVCRDCDESFRHADVLSYTRYIEAVFDSTETFECEWLIVFSNGGRYHVGFGATFKQIEINGTIQEFVENAPPVDPGTGLLLTSYADSRLIELGVQ